MSEIGEGIGEFLLANYMKSRSVLIISGFFADQMKLQ